MERFLFLFEVLGTVAFAASGALLGIHKGMDLFGVCILGLTTAVGGGIIRDVVLGCTPPATFQDPVYAAVSVAASLVLFWPGLRHLLTWNQAWFDRWMFWMDTAGLGSFTVVGVRAAYESVPQATVFLLVFVGAVTGVGGGVLRDMMAGDMPYVFRKHIYASASLAGALVCALLWRWGEAPAMLLGCGAVVLIRCLSAHFRWNLPRAREE